uniref:UBZ2-type domain-containing protein n=2 Tax=Acanthochromis polyacanthus TaxID=80966 RepID=A0A3Q1FJE5_9TELE
MKVDKPQWCDLSSEVAMFPESSAHAPRISSSRHSLSFSPYEQDLSEQMKPVPHPPDKQLFSPSWKSPNCKALSPQHSSKRQQLSLRRQDEAAASSAGPSNAGGEEGTAGGELEEDTGPVSRQLFMDGVKKSDSPVPLQKEGENKEGVTEEEDEEAEEVQRSVEVRIGRLQSCPMCLQQFPAGFTQMDCDGHLAQCLSEMNVDMTW